MSQAFKFLHAGDFHLEQPLYGVSEVPDDWRHLFVDAPLQAARKVFEAAIKEEVDFVVKTVVDKVKKLRELSPLYEMAQQGIDLKSITWAAH